MMVGHRCLMDKISQWVTARRLASLVRDSLETTSRGDALALLLLGSTAYGDSHPTSYGACGDQFA